jgi:uncharacterized phage protein gp47/JayE
MTETFDQFRERMEQQVIQLRKDFDLAMEFLRAQLDEAKDKTAAEGGER